MFKPFIDSVIGLGFAMLAGAALANADFHAGGPGAFALTLVAVALITAAAGAIWLALVGAIDACRALPGDLIGEDAHDQG